MRDAELARRLREDVIPYMERIGASGEGYTADYEIALRTIREATAAPGEMRKALQQIAEKLETFGGSDLRASAALDIARAALAGSEET